LCVIDSAGTNGYWQAHDLFFANAQDFQVDSLEAMVDEKATSQTAARYERIAPFYDATEVFA
jgi:uncharacterized DUF497 family protein